MIRMHRRSRHSTPLGPGNMTVPATTNVLVCFTQHYLQLHYEYLMYAV